MKLKFEPATARLPCLVMTEGRYCVKEMASPAIAAQVLSTLSFNCLLYHHCGLGSSNTGPSHLSQEIIPARQYSDIRYAIIHAQGRHDFDKDKLGLWGCSYSGGFSYLIAVDTQINVVVAVAPTVDDWRIFHRFMPPDVMNVTLKTL